jgi:anti-anti-sigma regulatory factor
MLRISEQTTSGDKATLLLEGEMVGIWVEEVRSSCERLLAVGRRLVLDLSGLSYVSHDGIILFHALKDRQVEFVNSSLFLNEQLKNGDALRKAREAHAEDNGGQ